MLFCYLSYFKLLRGIALCFRIFLSPNFYKSINGVACSFYKLIFHFLEGTDNDFPPSKWKGIQGLQDLINDYGSIYNKIEGLERQNCNSEDTYCLFYEEIRKKMVEESGNDKFKNSLENIKGEINEISDTFNSIKDEALDEMEKIMETLDKNSNLGLRGLFSVIFLFSFLSLITLIIYFTCNCECISCLYHLFWNFEIIIIIVTLLIGSIFGIVGVISKDAISILQYVKSSKNLNPEDDEETFLLKINPDARQKIDICFNKDGNLLDDEFEGSFESNIDDYYDNFEGNYSKFKTEKEFTDNKDLVEKYDQLDTVIKGLKNLNNNLAKGNLEKLFNCKFVRNDFDILVDQLNDSMVKKLLIYSYIIIIADLASVISIFFGIQVIKNYKGQNEPQQIETSERRIKSKPKETKNNMDLSSDNLRK